MLSALKTRFPKLYPVVAVVVALGAMGGAFAYERSAKGDCCSPGAACCHPGAACCAKHHGAHGKT